MQKALQKIPHKFILTLSLFLIGSLHTMIFAIFQNPENFSMGYQSEQFVLVCKILLYSFAIGTSLAHQWMCRSIGLRKSLYFGLICNLLGVLTLYINTLQGIWELVILDMIFFGMALTSVINVLVTYIIVEFPKHVGIGVVILFAFFNLGAMLAPLFDTIDLQALYSILGLLLIISLLFVHFFFFDPPKQEKVHMKKGSVIWKELHYRLGLFVIAIIAYALTETTFSLWGEIALSMQFGDKVAEHTIPFFWAFLIIGQIVLLIPLYFFSAKKIFYPLIILIITAALILPSQKSLAGYVGYLALAGFGCSAVFPILLSQMEKEMIPFANRKKIYAYIEKSISLMFAGYFTGVGIIDLWVFLFGAHPILPVSFHMQLAACFIAITGLVALFLELTSFQKKS